ncbi:MAG: cupin-like domain-containing protein [Planctomycetota bacterium]
MKIEIPVSKSLTQIQYGQLDTRVTIPAAKFYSHYVRKNLPLKLTGMMGKWPAMKRWSLEYFRELESTSEVHLENGNVMQGKTDFQKASFSQYIDQLIHDTDGSKSKAYLSVFRIFKQFPQLESDVDFSILNQFKVKSSTSGWIGPAGTVTGFHIDWGDNILAQISGRKKIHLVAPQYTPSMYVSRKFDQGTTISEVNLNDWDPNRFPKFQHVPVTELILHPGEMIFIPRGWWHHVESLDPSISVSNIAFDWKGIVIDVIPHRVKQLLHDWGLWKCECTCHVVVDGKWVKK